MHSRREISSWSLRAVSLVAFAVAPSIALGAPAAAPVLNPPANMTVSAGATANQTLTATDADGDPLTFSKVAGPTFMTVTTVTPGTGTGTGNINVAPGFSDAGTYGATVRASDGTLNSDKSLTIAVQDDVCRAFLLNQPSNMTLNEGVTADQTLTAQSPDGAPITFSKVSGPTFMTVTTIDATTGRIHLAPGFFDAGGYTAIIRATSPTCGFIDKAFTITVINVNRAPVLAQPANMTLNWGSTADQPIFATDADGDPLTFSKVSGPTFMTVTTTSPGIGTATGNIHLAPGFADAGTYGAMVGVTDGSLSDTKSLTITVNAVCRPPFLNQPANMTVAEGATADQTITASSPDGSPITFTKVSGPIFMTVTTTSSTTGNIHLAPGFSDAGTYTASVAATVGGVCPGTDTKSFTITVTRPNNPPALNPIANMFVESCPPSTADQAISGSDPDGDALTFTKTAGPTFMTVLTTSPTTGNIHLAPGFNDAGTYTATVRATDTGGLFDEKAFSITIFVANRAPVLTQPADMTVNEGATADQFLTGSDPCGDPLTFFKVAGPSFMTVTTTSPGTGTATGNVHLAPGFGDVGTYLATVAVSDGSLSDTKSFTIWVFPPDQPPVVSAPSNVSGVEGTLLEISVTASDPDGDPISSLTAAPLPSGATSTASADQTSGTLSWTPGFTQSGTYTITFTASNALSGSATTSVTIENANLARAFMTQQFKTIRLGSGKPHWCVQVEPVGGSFDLTSVNPATLVLISPGTGSVSQIPAVSDKTLVIGDADNNEIADMRVCFRKEDLRLLFSNLTGKSTVTATVGGDVLTGGSFRAPIQVDVIAPGGPLAASVSPNPLNPSAMLTFVTTRAGFARVRLYDLGGRIVRSLMEEPALAPGLHALTIDGRAGDGRPLASGIYYFRIEAVEGVEQGRFTLLK